MSDLVRNPKDRFSRLVAQITIDKILKVATHLSLIVEFTSLPLTSFLTSVMVTSSLVDGLLVTGTGGGGRVMKGGGGSPGAPGQ